MDPAILTIGLPQEAPRPTALRELLEPYSKEELVELIAKTSMSDVHFEQQWMYLLHHDTKWCKLFVHGLSYQTTNASLHEFYSQFGELKEAVVLMDKKGQSKGYGFVTFANRDGALAATKLERHKIDNRTTHCCLAFVGNPRKLEQSPPGSPSMGTSMPPLQQEGGGASSVSSVPTESSVPMSPSPSEGPRGSPHPANDDPSRSDRRLFVHSLAWKTDDETLRNTFAQYGEIEEAIVIRDKKSQKSKGYGFVVFTNSASASKALIEPEKTIDGRLTKCNLACERPANLPPSNHQPGTQTYGQSPPPNMGVPMQTFQQQMMNGTAMGNLGAMGNMGTMGNMAFVPMMAPVNTAGGPMVPLASVPGFNNGLVQPYMMGVAGGSSVSSGGQPFNPFGPPPSSVSSGPRGVLVPFGNVFHPQMQMNQQMPQMGATNDGLKTMGSSHKTKIIAVPAGNRSRNGNNNQQVRQTGGILPDSQGMHGRALPSVGSNEINDAQSDRSSPITQGSRTPEP